MASIAFVVGDAGSPHGTYETPFRDHMVNTLSHTVTYISDADAESTDFSSYAMIVISAIVDVSQVDGLKSTVKPILHMRRSAAQEFGFSTGNDDSSSGTQINIVDTAHYITRNESTGNLTVYDAEHSFGVFDSWGNDFNDLAQNPGDATECVLGEIDKGETLSDASSAADKRVYNGVVYGTSVDSNGFDLFNRCIEWLLGTDLGSADLSANVTIQNKSQADLSVNVTIQNVGQADLSSNVTIQNKGQYDLSANTTIRNKGQYDLSSNATIQNRGQADLSSSVTIQNKSQYDLSVNVTIQNKGQADQSANFTIQNKGQYDLSTNVTIQNRGQYDLSASFTIGTDVGYITLADAVVHNIPISSQTHTIELSNSNLPKQLNYRFSMHNIIVTAAIHDIELSDQTHQIVVSSEPLK